MLTLAETKLANQVAMAANTALMSSTVPANSDTSGSGGSGNGGNQRSNAGNGSKNRGKKWKNNNKKNNGGGGFNISSGGESSHPQLPSPTAAQAPPSIPLQILLTCLPPSSRRPPSSRWTIRSGRRAAASGPALRCSSPTPSATPTAAYEPPACLAAAARRSLALAVLEWTADCRGRQFDRIFGVWLSGAELLRSCTAGPRATSIVWSVSRDVSRYAALLSVPKEVAVYLGNLIDDTYTSVYHANLTLHLYFHPTPPPPPKRQQQRADLISTDVQSKKIVIPSNTYRAVLEVFVSFHSNDEDWYIHPPNEYIEANNKSGLPGNGAFREITVKVDNDVAGTVWPFTVIYTGGVNPLFWRPITGVGSFNLPTYDIDITPFLGKLLDGKEHDFGFSVTNVLDVWFIDANLHLWLDHNSVKTFGSLVSYEAPTLALKVDSDFRVLDWRFVTSASRHVSATGWMKSSYGEVMTTFYKG
ncbi:hypothetical protein E2562_017740 [Oryza meyeriana var. granulata]|uniref:Peptide N-acetyl-beta-D-glucosaminyl asparaginase amidase A N-terminal domain-containing protein n=1 Tax=Oryza meyeriana var. granulata TaxID=110450 RepID=A0A6G1BYJ6_9ORYZ|nr:hypothetical protein E2562_017740 [Oryza meyeriana var. granulata]